MRITEIQLLSDDPEETLRFYKDVMGFNINDQLKHRISIQCGFTKLIFRRSGNLHPLYHFAFNIPANCFQEAKNYIGERLPLIPVEGEHTIADFKNWNAKAIYFHDNNGNILEFIARFDLPGNEKNSFTGTDVLSVGEIGLVTENVTQYTDNLINIGILPFSKQPRLSDFAAMGDDEGLLIVAAQNRKWYPTETRSAVFETKIHLENNGKPFTIELVQTSGTA